jgi:hypothetical protein
VRLSRGSSRATGETRDSMQVLETRGEVWRGSSRGGWETGGTNGFGRKVLGKALKRFGRSRERVTNVWRRRHLVLTTSSRTHVNSPDSSGTLGERARSRLVDSRTDRGTSSGTLGTCGEEERRYGDSSRDSSSAADEMIGLVLLGMHEGDRGRSSGSLARAGEAIGDTGVSTGTSSR